MQEFSFYDPTTGKVIKISDDGQGVSVHNERNIDGILNRADRMGKYARKGSDTAYIGSVPIEYFLQWNEEGRLNEDKDFERLIRNSDYSKFFTGWK